MASKSSASPRPVWCISGAPGAGKSTLTNYLTDSKHKTGDGVAPVTTRENAKRNVANPDVTKTKERRLTDTEGIGDARAASGAKLISSTMPTVGRVLHGATGVVVCIKCFSRLLAQDAILIKELLDLAKDMPIIMAFTAYDNHLYEDEIGNPKRATKEYAQQWVDANKEEVIRILGIDPMARFRFVTISVVKTDVQDLIDAFEAIENEFKSKPNPYIQSEAILEHRRNGDYIGIANTEAVDRKHIEKLWKTTQTVIKHIVEQPWFKTWWARSLKLIPFVNILVELAEAFTPTQSK